MAFSEVFFFNKVERTSDSKYFLSENEHNSLNLILQTSISNVNPHNGVEVRECISLPTKARWYVAFKVSVTASDRDKSLNPEFWPAGVFVRKILKAKNSSSDA